MAPSWLDVGPAELDDETVERLLLLVLLFELELSLLELLELVLLFELELSLLELLELVLLLVGAWEEERVGLVLLPELKLDPDVRLWSLDDVEERPSETPFVLLDWDVRLASLDVEDERLLVDEDVRWSSLSDVEEESLLSFDVLRADVCVGRLFPSVVEVGRLSLPLSLVSLELLV